MQNNYFFLRQLSKSLAQRVTGFTVVSCFSQSKDELVIELNNGKTSFFIRADLTPSVCCLSFPEGFKRANKNSIDLFPEVILKKVTAVRQFDNERCFEIQLENSFSLLFKMHGNFSNILLCESQSVKSLFRNHLQTDYSIEIEKLNRTILWTEANFFEHIEKLKETFPVLGSEAWAYLKVHGFDQQSSEGKWKLWHSTLQQLESPRYYIARYREKIIFTLLPLGEILKEFKEAVAAVTEFYLQLVTTGGFENKKADALSNVEKKIKSTESFLSKNKSKLREIESDQHYQTWGDLIMANMHVVKPGLSKITLTDFYTGQPVEIKLKPELNAQKNAEVFYRKSKNHQIEIDKLRESIEQKEKELIHFGELREKIISSENFHGLASVTDSVFKKEQAKEKIKKLPYHEFEFKGFKIWVGKSAEANDELTLKHSFKDDLWLHAKDVAGSHVLIKYQSGKNFPKDVIEFAASLAAYHSKRKNESLCPVAFTPKKFVRKRKGDPAGLVVVEKEDVILVEPQAGDKK
jgi:predicted ribosome quality control (RQC) complex YloA/Tae2 family protein